MAAHEAEQRSYLFDDDALEKCLADGTDEQHEVVKSCGKGGRLFVTSETKRTFCNTFPDDSAILEENYAVFRGNGKDNAEAGTISDTLQNQFDVDDYDVQMKIFFLAKARRGHFTVVTGEEFSLGTTMQLIANALDVPCVSLTNFLQMEGK